MFANLRDFAEPSVSLETIREWAGSLASGYLNSQIDPTTALVKIASSEDLTPPIIELLAAETNKLIHTQKHASAGKDKYFAADFPHADAKKAIEELQACGSAKLAFTLPDPAAAGETPMDEHDMWGIKPEMQDKTASVRQELKGAHEKVALLSQKAGDREYMDKTAAAAAERKFIKEARQMVLTSDDSAGRMKVLGTIDHFVKNAGMSFARPSLAKLAYILGKEGLLLPKQAETAMEYFMKEADLKAPVELISEFLPARVVNGTHPLYITLKTFRDMAQAARESTMRRGLIDDKLDIVKQKVRAL